MKIIELFSYYVASADVQNPIKEQYIMDENYRVLAKREIHQDYVEQDEVYSYTSINGETKIASICSDTDKHYWTYDNNGDCIKYEWACTCYGNRLTTFTVQDDHTIRKVIWDKEWDSDDISITNLTSLAQPDYSLNLAWLPKIFEKKTFSPDKTKTEDVVKVVNLLYRVHNTFDLEDFYALYKQYVEDTEPTDKFITGPETDIRYNDDGSINVVTYKKVYPIRAVTYDLEVKYNDVNNCIDYICHSEGVDYPTDDYIEFNIYDDGYDNLEDTLKNIKYQDFKVCKELKAIPCIFFDKNTQEYYTAMVQEDDTYTLSKSVERCEDDWIAYCRASNLNEELKTKSV